MTTFRAACYGSACYGSSCYGSTACYGSGCYGSAANGCHGGAAEKKHGFLGIVDRMRGRRTANGNGCMGTSCYGSSCYGSSCYGSACYGSMACYGSACYGTVSYGCTGSVYHGCHGGCYGTAVYGAATHTGVIGEKVIGEKVITGTGTGTDQKMTDPKAGGAGTDKGKDGADKGKDKDGKNEEGANIKFQLPAAAKLFVDGRPTAGEGTERAFFTPPLAAGQKYFYDVKAELVVDGKTVAEEKRVIVEAGADVRASFAKLFAAAGGDPASVASK
jgi:uncharacterized protein (TIGR03000 family)